MLNLIIMLWQLELKFVHSNSNKIVKGATEDSADQLCIWDLPTSLEEKTPFKALPWPFQGLVHSLGNLVNI